jgi:heparanase 1
MTTSAPAADAARVEVRVGTTVVARLDDRFLSVGLDLGQVAGTKFWDPEGGGPDEGAATGGSAPTAPYDLGRPELIPMLQAFGPGYLRLGGTESDQLAYEAAGAHPDRDDAVLTDAQWDAAMALARATGYQVLFTANATHRRADGSWDPEPTRALISRAVANGDPVAGWSLGNEPNYFVFNYGGPDPTQLAADYRVFAELVRSLHPGAAVLGPAAAYWPTVGEMVPAMEAVLAGAGDVLDVVTWHYYPQQSERCTVAVRPATAAQALTDEFLAEVEVHQATVRALRDRYAPQADIWLQETGNAQCGGQPGLSDTVRASFWWVTQLGRVARQGSRVVVRWNLSGADYALLREPALEPNPDWWINVLWHRLVGPEVLDAVATGPGGEPAPLLDVFAHRAAPPRSGMTVIVVNRAAHPVVVDFPDTDTTGGQCWRLDAEDLSSRVLRLDGSPLRLAAAGQLPALPGTPIPEPRVALGPRTIAFVTLPAAS